LRPQDSKGNAWPIASNRREESEDLICSIALGTMVGMKREQDRKRKIRRNQRLAENEKT